MANTILNCISHEKTGPGLVTFGAALAGAKGKSSRLYALRLIRPADRASFVLEPKRVDVDGGAQLHDLMGWRLLSADQALL